MAYENAADASKRLTALAITVLGGPIANRAQTETAWPALIAALRRAEAAGFDPEDALTRTATNRELRTARSVSQVIAWRVNRHVAAHPSDSAAEPGAAPADGSSEPASASEALLPWVPGPRQTAPEDGGAATSLAAYINDTATTITTRVNELADTAIRHRPPWMSLLGQQPPDPRSAREWRRHIAVVAAYRDQHHITTHDPSQVLGPYVEQGRAHKAYWNAAGSAFTARRLAATPGITWLGDPTVLDEHAAEQPAHAWQLGSVLARRGHAPGGLAFPYDRQQADGRPVEAALGRRGVSEQAAKHAQRAGDRTGTEQRTDRTELIPPQPHYRPNERTPSR